jgi:hypothetical protein
MHDTNKLKVVQTRIGTLTVAATYIANDFVGTSATAITFKDVVDEVGGSGHILSGLFMDGDLQSVAGELWLFTVAPAGLGADSAAFTVSDADMVYCIGILPFSTYYASVLNSISRGVPSAPIDFRCAETKKDIYGAFVTRGAPTYTTNVPLFTLNVWVD